MKEVLFYRTFKKYQGGHLKVWDYFLHVLTAGDSDTASIGPTHLNAGDAEVSVRIGRDVLTFQKARVALAVRTR